MCSNEEKYNLIYEINMISAALKDGLRKEFLKNDYDITIDHFAILFRLWQQDSLTQQQLCDLTCKNKSNLTRILDTMEKKDMLRRNLNPADRRSFIISLTEYSRSLQAPVTEIALKYSDRFFSRINDEDFKTLQRILSPQSGLHNT
ncbi:MAG: MarR family transcriptional regulator [Oscillospiraceae bacterium]|jgi:DNA-binding MarR family transcriptional regulator|nr:MarR family transcriptional regulator [Oscillospiraceae bacterium]